MTPVRAVVRLGWVIAALGAIAAAGGLFVGGGSGPVTFTSARGQVVALYGQGLYRYESVFTGAGNRGLDAVTLALAVPLLLAALWWYRRGSTRAALLLTACLGYFVYVYASMAFGTAWNPLFLVYVALLSASLFALVRLLAGAELRGAAAELFAAAPRRGPALFLISSGVVTAVVWLMPVGEALLSNRPPKLLDHATTLFTYALDLAVIVPGTLVAGTLIWRRNPLGYLLSLPALGLIILLGPVIAASTASQRRAGVVFTAGEVIGPIASFVLLGGLAVWVLAAILRPASRGATT